jgi:hypothetical protein
LPADLRDLLSPYTLTEEQALTVLDPEGHLGR